MSENSQPDDQQISKEKNTEQIFVGKGVPDLKGSRVSEAERTQEIVGDINQGFAQVAESHPENKSVFKTYREQTEKIINESVGNRKGFIGLNEAGARLGGIIKGAGAEVSSRTKDLVYKATNWPYLLLDKDRPRDPNYQMAKAKAEAWGLYNVKANQIRLQTRLSDLKGRNIAAAFFLRGPFSAGSRVGMKISDRIFGSPVKFAGLR